MDKTRNKIFVGCLALLLVMVAGYALFSQNLNITGTAKAQGDFSVTATCQPGIPANLLDAAKYSIVEYYSKTWVDENGYYDDSCTVKGDTVSFNSSFKWPGARRYFTIKVKNTGSINFSMSPDQNRKNDEEGFCLDKNNNGEFDLDECETGGNSGLIGSAFLDNEIFEDAIAIETPDGKLYAGNDFDTLTEEERNNLLPDGEYLKPGFSYYFLGVTGWVNIDSPENYKMLAKTTFSTKLTYKQPAVK